MEQIEAPDSSDSHSRSSSTFTKAVSAGLLALTLVPLAPLAYYLPYAIRGCGKYAFYEFGGYFLLWLITPAIGLMSALCFMILAALARFRRTSLCYGLVAILMVLGFMIHGLLDMIPTFGD